MDEIESLRRRAEQAQQRISRPGARSGQMSDRLAELVEAVDAEIAGQADVIDQHKADIARLNAELEEAKGQAQRFNQENEQVRAILKSLLLAIEGEGTAGLGETMVQLETKVSALVDEEGMDAQPVEAPADAIVELGEEDIAEQDAVADEQDAETVELGEADPIEQDELSVDPAVPAEEAESDIDVQPDAAPELEVAMDEPSEIGDEAVAEPAEIALEDEVVDVADAGAGAEAELAAEGPAEDLDVAMSDAEFQDEATAATLQDDTEAGDVLDVADTVGRYLEEDGAEESQDVEAPVSAIGDIVERLKSEKQLSEPTDPESLAS